MAKDTAFELATSNIRFGPGVTREVGMDLTDLGAKRTMVVIDPFIAGSAIGDIVRESLNSENIDFAVFDQVRIEPSDDSFQTAIQFAADGSFDSYVAVGGGSTIDTAKAANLYATYPAEFFDYVNAPIGLAKPIPGPLKPLIALPTTAGTGSETTGVAIFDLKSLNAKTGIAHRRLKPTLGLVDPNNTQSMPATVAASTGLDVLSHAIESFTALPYTQRVRPERPLLRPAYQGSNPISDLWALQALRMVQSYLIRAVRDPNDSEARGMMMLAAAYAGIGFGNAGVHLPHGMSYPVASLVKDFKPDGYATDHPIVPHGISVILNAPSVFRFTASACPERHLQAASALGANIDDAPPDRAGEVLANCIIDYMKKLDMPNGLCAVGYTESDVPQLVEGTLPQHRVTKLSPRSAEQDDLSALFKDALRYW